MSVQPMIAFLMRYRFTIWDSTIITAVGGLLVFFGMEYDLLLKDGLTPVHAGELEVSEIGVVAVIMGMLVFVANRRMRAQQVEMSRRIAAEQHARELAFQDPLTGLANRRRFDEAVGTAVGSPPSADRVHAVFMLDLNRFKAINDVYGHPVGDEALVVVASRLAGVVRETGDLVARFGGDEFGIVATHLRGPEEATGIGLRIIEAMQSPVRAGNVEHPVGVGIGVALFPRDGADAEEIVRRADIALYRAKAESQSVLKFFQEQMDAQVRERASLESELRKALEAGDIKPHYQPQVDLHTGRITGFESLARWQHASLGDVPPERFIPIAEECGLISGLGSRLLRVACLDALQWPPDTVLSVNVSPAQLHSKDFATHVLTILRETNFPPQRLELEITENTLVRDLQAARQALMGLREFGVRIALDDFGTGYSSLYHLRNFKIDRIKIDRSFVENMEGEPESAAIVRALLGLGRGLGVQVTAEGVETAEQRTSLLTHGCDLGQGHLFSKALSAAEARSLFSQ